jgi:hypothetical protein
MKLCMFKDRIAYFSELDPVTQSSLEHDWTEPPEEASIPTEHEVRGKVRKIVRVFVDMPWGVAPQDICGVETTIPAFSVEQINRGSIAWISGVGRDRIHFSIFAGEPIETFKKKIRQAGGVVFVEER